ncbi:Ig-like domain-containing protein [Algibacter mikhailovii]|uniref:Ig-like domain-containing protein n=1 Tax=Algibacter mikhailovii TaxID=425498 RepID=UPI00249585AD|nr:Ig-like domain-containing protein [Algibacter mikhailovii]
MKNLHLKSKIMLLILFFLTLLPSCNNEELFVDESYVLAQEKRDEEDSEGNEDADESSQIEVNDYSFNTNENIPVDLFIFSNDLNIQPTVIFSSSNPDNGVIILRDNDTPEDKSDDFVTYTPNSRFSGIDTFEYTLCDSSNPENCDSARVTISVNAMDKAAVLKAFPNAYGGGAESIGGRGKVLCIVNTLNFDTPLTYHRSNGSEDEYYTGGLKEAIENKNVGHIVFNVSGNIRLPEGGVNFTGVANKTIYGQSAPKGGITITGGRFMFTYTPGYSHDLTFRYFRSRPIISRYGLTPDVAFVTDFRTLSGNSSAGGVGDDAYTWAFKFTGGERIILDHCSASFAYDKNVGGAIRSTSQIMKDWTFSNNVVADGDTNMYFEHNDNGSGAHNIPDNISVINNVMTSANRSPNMAFGGYGEIINNVVFNIPSKYTTAFWNLKLSQIGNYYCGENKDSGIISAFARNRITSTGTSSTEPNSKPEIYTNGNYVKRSDNTIVLDGNPNNNDRVLWSNYIDGFASPPKFGGQEQFFTDAPHSNTITHKYIPVSATNAFRNLILEGDAGACKYMDDKGEVQVYMDSFDASQLKYVANNDISYERKKASNWVLPIIPNNVRSDDYDTDHDGMADAWEIRTFGNLDQSYRGDFNGDGYDNIETFLNQVDK